MSKSDQNRERRELFEVIELLAGLTPQQRALLEAELSEGSSGDSAPMYGLSWRVCSIPEPFDSVKRSWLILGGAEGLAQAVQAQLQQRGDVASIVRSGGSLLTPSDESWTARLSDPSHIAALVQRIGKCDGIINLVALTMPDAEVSAGRLTSQAQPALSSLVACVQGLELAGVENIHRLLVVTRQAQRLGEQPSIAITQSSLWGLQRVIALEHINQSPSLLDLDAFATNTESATAIVDESQREGRPEESALRDGVRYVHRLEALGELNQSSLTLDPHASYLITGGAGGLGQTVARQLAALGARHLLLMGRRESVPAVHQLKAELAANGVHVRYAASDVSDLGRLQQLLASIPSEQPLRGIVHAAGVRMDAMVRSISREQFLPVLAPKMDGAWNLHIATKHACLDFFVLFSSIAALGNAGQANYAAANAFLDAFAHRRRLEGLCATSINWPGWADAGMTARMKADERARFRRQGVRFIGHDEGAQLLSQAIANDLTQVVVLPIDWPAFLRSFPRDTEPATYVDLVTSRRSSPDAGRAQQIAPPESVNRDHVAAVVAAEVRECLGLEPDAPIDPRRPLMDLGLSSLLANTLRFRLAERLTLDRTLLPATLVYNNPTVDALSEHLTDLLAPPSTTALASLGERGAAPNRDCEIAVVGMACRFPGRATSPEALWQMLRDGVDAISDPPTGRGSVSDQHSAGGFVSTVGSFDPTPFQISPREAGSMDPQHQLLLETAWEALERAGRSPQKLEGTRTGVFVSVYNPEFFHLRSRHPGQFDAYTAAGMAQSSAAGRISSAFGLQGPSTVVDAACSSSLVAVHLACASLRQRECDLAVVGAASALLSTEMTEALKVLGIVAPDGRCKTFDAGANGYGRAEGSGVIVLERAEPAGRGSVPILATIAGTAVNHDGRSASFVAPNGRAQAEVIRAALENAELTPLDVGYVEAMGTGSLMGDAIELGAFGEALGPGREERLIVGASKANVGHTEAPSGLLGIIKVIMSMHHDEIPPQIRMGEVNPDISLGGAMARIETQRAPWPRLTRASRVAGVHSFGLSGTNAHVIVAKPAPNKERAVATTAPGLFVLSAASDAALRRFAARYAVYIREHPSIPLSRICAMAMSRAVFPIRLAAVATDRGALAGDLASFGAGRHPTTILSGSISGREAGWSTVSCFRARANRSTRSSSPTYEQTPSSKLCGNASRMHAEPSPRAPRSHSFLGKSWPNASRRAVSSRLA